MGSAHHEAYRQLQRTSGPRWGRHRALPALVRGNRLLTRQPHLVVEDQLLRDDRQVSSGVPAIGLPGLRGGG